MPERARCRVSGNVPRREELHERGFAGFKHFGVEGVRGEVHGAGLRAEHQAREGDGDEVKLHEERNVREEKRAGGCDLRGREPKKETSRALDTSRIPMPACWRFPESTSSRTPRPTRRLSDLALFFVFKSLFFVFFAPFKNGFLGSLDAQRRAQTRTRDPPRWIPPHGRAVFLPVRGVLPRRPYRADPPRKRSSPAFPTTSWSLTFLDLRISTTPQISHGSQR